MYPLIQKLLGRWFPSRRHVGSSLSHKHNIQYSPFFLSEVYNGETTAAVDTAFLQEKSNSVCFLDDDDDHEDNNDCLQQTSSRRALDNNKYVCRRE